ncbi:hypothetical protein CUR95_24015 [Bordetella bronchiseptica]|nr:hypothetical protein [Bordetella bronchiseptica]
MIKVHEIRDGVVVNTYLVGRIDDHPGVLLVPADIGEVGWRYVDGELLPPEVIPAPAELAAVSRFQALAALMQADLLDAVAAWANDANTDPLHKLAFETATEFRRDSPTLAAGAAALGWTAGQLDDLFSIAQEIRA